MPQNIDTTIKQVNRFNYLTQNNPAYKFLVMRFGERLKKARLQKGLTQAALAGLAEITQPTIWHLESHEKNASGSEFTPRLARILSVSVDWLADEIGEMVPVTYTTSDPKLVSMLKVIEPQPEYVKEAAVTAVLTTCELATRAKANGQNS